MSIYVHLLPLVLPLTPKTTPRHLTLPPPRFLPPCPQLHSLFATVTSLRRRACAQTRLPARPPACPPARQHGGGGACGERPAWPSHGVGPALAVSVSLHVLPLPWRCHHKCNHNQRVHKHRHKHNSRRRCHHHDIYEHSYGAEYDVVDTARGLLFVIPRPCRRLGQLPGHAQRHCGDRGGR